MVTIMRILVTGVGGNANQILVPLLLKAGHMVIAMDTVGTWYCQDDCTDRPCLYASIPCILELLQCTRPQQAPGVLHRKQRKTFQECKGAPTCKPYDDFSG